MFKELLGSVMLDTSGTVGGSATQTPTPNQSPLFIIVWIVVLGALFYFMMYRPQKKKEKQKKNEKISAEQRRPSPHFFSSQDTATGSAAAKPRGTSKLILYWHSPLRRITTPYRSSGRLTSFAPRTHYPHNLG